MNPCRILFGCVLVCASGWAHSDGLRAGTAHNFAANVIAVLDGDTVLILRKAGDAAAGQNTTGPMKIRLASIDAPEKAQAFGLASRDALSAMVLRKQVSVETLAVDKYGRSVAQLEVNGLSVNEEMVRRGMAWEYSHYHSDRRYIALQRQARLAGRGLWAQNDPLPPWEWRLRHVTDGTTSHSTRRANNARLVAGYGEASRLREQPPTASSTIKESQADELGRRKQHATEAEASPALSPRDYRCGTKHACSQMRSCDEAYYYLNVCDVTGLNPEGDGVPCSRLCTGGGAGQARLRDQNSSVRQP